jgi:DegV family protein with EDD domain
VPQLLYFEDESYRDGVDITADDFYERLRKARKLPSTAVSGPGVFLEAYRELSQSAEGIVFVAISSLLSAGVFQSATLAKETAKESLPDIAIEVVDSRTVAGALGFVVLAAARAASQGASMAEVVAAAKSMIPKVNLLAILDTLFYLARGGRIGTASAWLGSLLSIKPILENPTTTGYTERLEQARTKPRAIKRLLEIVEERVGQAPLHAIVHHAGVPDEGEALMAQIAAKFNCAELYLTSFTPVMGAHTGPGLVGVSFYAGD